MVSLKLQKRLAASVLGCGLRKVWLDPNEANEISMANSSELGSSGPPRARGGGAASLGEAVARGRGPQQLGVRRSSMCTTGTASWQRPRAVQALPARQQAGDQVAQPGPSRASQRARRQLVVGSSLPEPRGRRQAHGGPRTTARRRRTLRRRALRRRPLHHAVLHCKR